MFTLPYENGNLAQGCKVVQPRGYIWENTGLRKDAKTLQKELLQPCATLYATSFTTLRNLICNLSQPHGNLIRNLAGTVAASFATLQ